MSAQSFYNYVDQQLQAYWALLDMRQQQPLRMTDPTIMQGQKPQRETGKMTDYFDGVAEYPTQIDKGGNLCRSRMDARSTVVIEKAEALAVVKEMAAELEAAKQQIAELEAAKAELEHTFVFELDPRNKYAIFVKAADGYEIDPGSEGNIKEKIEQPLIDLGCHPDNVRVIVADGLDFIFANIRGLTRDLTP